MALAKFGFAFEVERDLFAKAQMAKAIESSVWDRLSKNDYGAGVRNVAIGVIVMDREHARLHPVRKPVYKPGKWRARGIPLEFEDTLEFDIRPSIDEVRSAVTAAEVAELIRRALGFVLPALQKLSIPNFDTARFIVDLDEALKTAATTENTAGTHGTRDQQGSR